MDSEQIAYEEQVDKIIVDYAPVNTNSYFDKQELKAFTKVFLAKMMPGAADLDDDAFEGIFKNFDPDGKGTIDKNEVR